MPKSEVQSVLFERPTWSKMQAVAWLKKHKFKHTDLVEKEKHWRFNQIPVEEERKKGKTRFRIIRIATGIEFILAI